MVKAKTAKFSALRIAIAGMGLIQDDIADFFGLSKASVSSRFTGRIPWSLTEMYQLMDLIKEPDEKLNYYFPRGGKANGTA